MRSPITLAVILAACTANAQAPEVGAQLAPENKLRVGAYPGSPLSMVRDKSGEIHGISIDLGKELARRLGVTFEQVTYSRIAEILDAMKRGEVDFTISNATASRALDVDFSEPLLSLELGFLVPARSPIRDVDDIDKPGVRVGVTKGSTSERTLPKQLKNASVVPALNLGEAMQMLSTQQLDAFATNKSILFEMSDQMSGAQVLDGNWGVEYIAIAIPKGRGVAHEYMRSFVKDVQHSGYLAQAIGWAGLRGTIGLK
jgi:polar amino acid transport system substrate-binding protein